MSKKIIMSKPVQVSVPNGAKVIRDVEYLTLAIRDQNIVLVYSKPIEDIEPNADLTDKTHIHWVEYTKEEIEGLYKIFHPNK